MDEQGQTALTQRLISAVRRWRDCPHAFSPWHPCFRDEREAFGRYCTKCGTQELIFPAALHFNDTNVGVNQKIMNEPIWKKGEFITCTNGHVIGEVLRDVHLGDMNWGDAFGNWRQEDHPKTGSERHPLCAICGAEFSNAWWGFHTQDGWRNGPYGPFEFKAR